MVSWCNKQTIATHTGLNLAMICLKNWLTVYTRTLNKPSDWLLIKGTNKNYERPNRGQESCVISEYERCGRSIPVIATDIQIISYDNVVNC